ncbi:hypothetical protein FOZ62_028661, partial [Perkinsus olseni]
MANQQEAVNKNILEPLLDGEAIDQEIKDLMLAQLVEEKIYSIMLLANVGEEAVTRMTSRLPVEQQQSFKLHLVSLIDEAKAWRAAKRRRHEQEGEANDLATYRENLRQRFGQNAEPPTNIMPPTSLIAKVGKAPYDYIPVQEFLGTSSSSTNATGVKHLEDINTGKMAAVRIGKVKKINTLAQWVEGFCKWCMALLLVEPDNQVVNPLGMLSYLVRVVSLAEEKSPRSAILFDHAYRSKMAAFHEAGNSITQVLSDDLAPSLYVGAQLGTLDDKDHIYGKDEDTRRDEICVYFQRGHCRRGSPIRAHLLGALLKACGYSHEGAILEHEIAQGFALGHHVPVPPSTLWPKAKKHPPVDCRRVFENYRSAEEHPDKLSTILQSEVLSGRMELVDEDSAGSAVITPVALIPKGDCPKDPSLQKAEHFRVIEDYRRSHRNRCAHSVECKRPTDLVLTVVDIKSAFRLLGVRQQETVELNVRAGGVTYRHRCLPFGHRSSPFNFSRTAGAVHRMLLLLTALLLWFLFGLLYVDDMFFAIEREHGVEGLGLILAFWGCLGFGFSYRKLHLGRKAKFVGYEVEIANEGIYVTVPQEKLQAITENLRQTLAAPFVNEKSLASLAGKLSWALYCFKLLRPYLSTTFGALSLMKRKHLRSMRTPKGLRQDLSFLLKVFGDLDSNALSYPVLSCQCDIESATL